MTATAQAYVLSDGEVISSDYLEQYASKAAHSEDSRQIPLDSFGGTYDRDSLVEPLYNLEALAQLPEINTYHLRSLTAKAVDTVGQGWSVEAVEGVDNPSDAERDRLQEFFDRCNPGLDLTELLMRVATDLETIGNGYIEVIVNKDGTPAGLEHIPGHTVRVHRDSKRFAQVRGAKRVWFKRIGLDDIDVNYITGDTAPTGQVPPDQLATQVIHLRKYTSRSDYYGLPDIIPALGAVMGDRKRAEYNITFFDNNAVPAYAVTLTGAGMSESVKNKIKKFFQHDVKNNPHSTLVLTAASDQVGAPPVEFTFEKLATETKEASFEVYRQSNRDEVLSAHGVPPYRAGIVVEGQLSGSSADSTTEIYKQSIVRPGQRQMEERLNRFVVRDLFGIVGWRIAFEAIDSRDDAVDIANDTQLFNNGAMTPNEMRAARGMERVDDPAMDKYYINGKPIDAAPTEQATVESVKALHTQLVNIAAKDRGSNQ